MNIPLMVGITSGYLAGEEVSSTSMYCAVTLMPIFMFIKVVSVSFNVSYVGPLLSMKMKAAVSTRIYSTVRYTFRIFMTYTDMK